MVTGGKGIAPDGHGDADCQRKLQGDVWAMTTGMRGWVESEAGRCGRCGEKEKKHGENGAEVIPNGVKKMCGRKFSIG
jgi:hypothetical protein